MVEDEFLIASDCEIILEEAGHEVVGVAADELEALELAERTRPDLVLMDIRLRRGDDGVKTARAILSELGIRSIFVSAHGEGEVGRRACAAEPLGWVRKPYTAEVLLDAVDRAAAQIGRPASGGRRDHAGETGR